MLIKDDIRYIIVLNQQIIVKMKGSEDMSEKEKKIMQIFAVLIPKLSESDKKYLLGLGEGMALKLEQRENKVEQMKYIAYENR